MAPRVRLVLHPADPAFAAEPSLRLAIELPPGAAPDDLIREIEAILRRKYPAATIEPGEVSADGTEVVWHVYRERPEER